MFLLFHLQVKSQDYHQFTIDDGLPSNLVYGVLEDSEQYLWFYTNNGVVKYDGYDLKVFGYTEGLPETDIWYMYEDMHKRKWLINSSGINYYIQHDSIRKLSFDFSYTIRPERLYFIDEGLIYNIGHILYAILGDDIIEIKYGKKDIVSVEAQVNDLPVSDATKSKLKKYITNIDQSINLNHFLPQRSYGNESKKFEFDIDGLHVEVFKNAPKIVLKDGQHTYVERLENSLLYEVNTVRKDEDLLVLDHTNGQIHYDIKKRTITNNIRIPTFDIHLTRGMKIGDKYFSGSMEDGVIIYNHESMNKFFPENQYQLIGVKNDQVYFLDDKLNMWKENNMAGHNPIDINVTIPTLQSFLKRDGNIYGFQKNDVYSLTDQTISHKTRIDSFYNTIESNTKILDIEAPKDILLTDSLCMILQYSQVFILNKNRDIHWGDAISGLNFQTIEHYKDVYLVGSTKGIFEIGDIKLHPSESFPQFEGKKINLIKNLGDDQLAIVSNSSNLDIFRNGIKQLEYQFDFPITILSQYDSLLYVKTGNTIFRLVIGDQKKLKKIAKRSFSSFDKIRDIACTSRHVYIASESGYYKIRHEDFEGPTGDIRMIELTLNNQDALKKTSLYIPPASNDINVQFKALAVSSLANIEYKYKLLPIDSTFNNTRELSVDYQRLAPGNYTFQIYASDINGNDTSIKAVSFTILNPWYKRTETYFFGMLIIIGLISLFYNLKLKQLKAEEAKKRAYTKRLAEQKMTALRAQMNPHFIFNVLSSIQSAIRTENIEAADDYLVSFAELIRKYLDFSDTQQISLNEEIKLLRLYTSVENLRFNSSINVDFNIDDKLDLDAIYIPSMLIQPFVENAINHGLFYKKNNRSLTIRFQKKEHTLHIEIEDNGIGRDKSINARRFKAANHTSKAISNIKARIETLNVMEDIDVSFEIIDKRDKNDKPTGTLVKLKINIDGLEDSNY